jgi:hypothetical protein
MAVSDWEDFMPESVNIKERTGLSVSGGPAYEPDGTNFVARIELKNRLIVANDGREVMARGRVYLGTTTIIDIRSQLTLPTGYVPASPPILAVNIAADESGTHHVVLEIG